MVRWLVYGMIAGAIIGLAGLGMLWWTGQLGTSATEQAEAFRYSLPIMPGLGALLGAIVAAVLRYPLLAFLIVAPIWAIGVNMVIEISLGLVRLDEARHALTDLGRLVQIDLTWANPTAVAANIFIIGMLLARERAVRLWWAMALLLLLGTIIAFLIGRAFPDSMWKAQPAPGVRVVRWERIIPIICGSAAAWIAAYFLGGVGRGAAARPDPSRPPCCR